MIDKQPEALRFADVLERMPLGEVDAMAAAELRRQYALIEEMRNALKKINDGLYCDDSGNWCLPNSFDAQQLDEVISKSEPQS